MTNSLVTAMRAGAMAGGLVLGIGGRFATAVVAITIGHSSNLSGRGLLEGLMLGVVAGTVGALALPLLRSHRRPSGSIPGVAVGMLVFGGSVVVARFGHRVEHVTESPTPLTLAVVGAVCVAYGIVANALFTRFERGRDRH